MISAALFTMLLWHPSSPVLNLIPNPFIRRMLTGMAMGGTAIALVFSPLGKRSGAHFNPAVTLTFWRLGKVKNWDAFFYVIAQFIGGIAGVFVVALGARATLSHPAVNCVATLPGPHGMAIAFIAEVIIAFILMTVVLECEQHAAPGTLHWDFRRMPGCDLHHLRRAFFWHEHESRSDVQFGFCRSSLDRTLDLFHCAGARHAARRPHLSTIEAHSLLREISSPQQPALHF
jgi:Major intrinsic protein